VHGGRTVGGTHGDSDLRVVDAGEVAGTSGLVLLGLEREGVRVHTGVGGTGVVVEGLHLVEVLALLSLEAILTVEDELELGEGTDGILSEGGAHHHQRRGRGEGNRRRRGRPRSSTRGRCQCGPRGTGGQ
jgi:hypothetical protein